LKAAGCGLGQQGFICWSNKPFSLYCRVFQLSLTIDYFLLKLIVITVLRCLTVHITTTQLLKQHDVKMHVPILRPLYFQTSLFPLSPWFIILHVCVIPTCKVEQLYGMEHSGAERSYIITVREPASPCTIQPCITDLHGLIPSQLLQDFGHHLWRNVTQVCKAAGEETGQLHYPHHH